MGWWAVHQPVGKKGWGLVLLSVHACVCVCVCVCSASTGPYMCAHKISVWGATLCVYLWHVCDVACASPNLCTHARARVHICCLYLQLCVCACRGPHGPWLCTCYSGVAVLVTGWAAPH